MPLTPTMLQPSGAKKMLALTPILQKNALIPLSKNTIVASTFLQKNLYAKPASSLKERLLTASGENAVELSDFRQPRNALGTRAFILFKTIIFYFLNFILRVCYFQCRSND